MSDKRSPGPWRWNGSTECRALLDANGKEIVHPTDYGDSVGVTEADAHLIADAWKLPRLEAEHAEMLVMLNKAAHIGSVGYCPWCSEWNGHFTSCELVALLARIDGDPTP